LFPALQGRPPSGQPRVYATTAASFLASAGFELVDHLAEADLVVADVLDDTLRQYLLEGGRVVWLAEAPDALQTSLGEMHIQPRQGSPWQGDWASSLGWICQDGPLANLPPGAVMDFAYTGLTPEHVVRGFASREFAQQVHAGLFVGWLQRPIPTLAERRVGRGHLLISTFRLSQALAENPLAQQMLLDMAIYLAGAPHLHMR